MTDSNAWCINALEEELGGKWCYIEGSTEPKRFAANFDHDTGILLTRMLKRWNVPHEFSVDGHSIVITLSENQIIGIGEVACEICDKFRKPENNHITIASKIADGSLKTMLDERDKGIYR